MNIDARSLCYHLPAESWHSLLTRWQVLPVSKAIDLKYQLLADELEDAIRKGRLPIGSRLQSVRKIMAQRAVSLATVLSAYRCLEERGLVAARPKSGYFVLSNGVRLA